MKNLKLFEEFLVASSYDKKKTYILGGEYDSYNGKTSYSYWHPDESKSYGFFELVKKPIQQLAIVNKVLLKPDNSIISLNIDAERDLAQWDDNNERFWNYGLELSNMTEDEFRAYSIGFYAGSGGYEPDYIIIDKDRIKATEEEFFKIVTKDISELKSKNIELLNKIKEYTGDSNLDKRVEASEKYKGVIKL